MIVINYTNYNIKNTTRKPSLIEVLFIKYSLALFSFSNLLLYLATKFQFFRIICFYVKFLIEISYYLKS